MVRIRKKTAVATIVAAGVVVWLGSSGYVAWNLTRRSQPLRAEPAPEVGWGKLESYRLKTSDGEQIGAWLMRQPESRGTVLLLHGLDGSRREMLPLMQFLAENGFDSLAITLRAHGDSTGESQDFGYSARHDVIAAVEFLEKEYPGQPVFVLGRSMGAAAVLFAAEELGERVDGYFLESPYKDLNTAVWKRVERELPPGLDRLAYAGLWLWSGVFLPVNASHIAPCQCSQFIPQDVPVVVVTGSNDWEAPPEEVREVFTPVESHGKFDVFPGASHAVLYDHDQSRYHKNLLELISP